MNWEEATVATLREGVRTPVHLKFAVGEPCRVEVQGPGGHWRGEGLDLFDALGDVRLQLEQDGVLLFCHGARRDVFPSNMQRQATQGRRAYVQRYPRTTDRPPVVDIFDPAPDDADIVTVADQRAAHEAWATSPLDKG